MIAYIPIYTGKREIMQIETDNYKRISTNSICAYSKNKGFYGQLLPDTVFATYDDCRKYWSKEPVKRLAIFDKRF